MGGSRFQRLAALFDIARELPTDDRAAWLDRECGPDEGLRAEVEALLARHDAVESSGRETLLIAGSRLRDDLATASSAEEVAEEPLPDQVGRFRIHGEIARGGFGLVLRGEDATIGRQVAIKVLLPGRAPHAQLARLLRAEGQICGRLQHPGIVPVYELGDVEPDRPFVAMKVVEGKTLTDLLNERTDLSTDRARFLSIFEQVCQAIAYAHARGVVHRDLKPRNLMVGAFGEVQVMDWGLAELFDADADERDFVTLGTPAYMAPEQARGEARALDPRSDVFGLGAILCEMLTGQPPFTGMGAVTTLECARAGDLSDAYRRVDACGADPEIISLAKRCLAADALLRPRDAREVATAVRSYIDSLDRRARDAELEAAAARARATTERTRRRLATSLGLVVVLATVIGASVWLSLTEAARERQQSATAGLLAALREAERLAADAAAERPESSTRWEAASTTAANAARLIVPDADEGIAAQVRALQERAAQRLRDLQFAERLEAIALEDQFLSTYDRSGQLDAYADALTDYAGLDIDGAGLEAARVGLARYPFRERLIAALDMWTMIERQVDPSSPRARRLQKIADDLDDQPWRKAVRAAVAARDTARLRELAALDASADAPAAARVFLAIQLAADDELAGAITLLQRAADEFPSDFETVFNLGMFLQSTTDDWQAVRYATAACALRPNSALPYTVLATALYDLTRRDDAVRAARRAIQLAQGDYGPSTIAAGVLFATGHVDEVEAVLADQAGTPRNHTLFPAIASLRGNLRATQGRFGDALDAFLDGTTAPSAWPTDPDWRLGVPGLADGIRAELDARIAASERRDPALLFLLGRLLEDLGDLRGALTAMEEVQALAPDRPFVDERIRRLWGRLGGARSSIAAVDDAIEALEPALSIDDARRAVLGADPTPTSPIPGLLDFVEGRLLARAGRYGNAIPWLQRTVDADRDSQIAWQRLHQAWIADAGRTRADAELRRQFDAGPIPAQALDIPPAAPTVVEPADGTVVRGDVTLRIEGFRSVDPRHRHRHTVWQLRDIDSDYARAPRLDVLADDASALVVPSGILEAGRRFGWRAAFLTDESGLEPEWCTEHVFVVADDAPRPLPIDLTGLLDVDLIAAPGDTVAGDAFDPPNGFQLVVEGFDGTRTDAPTVQGLPADRRIGVHRLRPYDGPNGRRFDPRGPRDARVEVRAGRYVGFRLLAASANGNAMLPVDIVYSDGTSVRRPWSVPDWFSEGRPARVEQTSFTTPTWRRMDRMEPNGVEERNQARLFESFVPCDPSRAVVALVLGATEGRYDAPSTTVNLLAITAMVAPAENGR